MSVFLSESRQKIHGKADCSIKRSKFMIFCLLVCFFGRFEDLIESLMTAFEFVLP